MRLLTGQLQPILHYYCCLGLGLGIAMATAVQGGFAGRWRRKPYYLFSLAFLWMVCLRFHEILADFDISYRCATLDTLRFFTMP